MRAARRHDWFIHYEICRMHGDDAKAEMYAANLRKKFKTADAELKKIDKRIAAKRNP